MNKNRILYATQALMMIFITACITVSCKKDNEVLATATDTVMPVTDTIAAENVITAQPDSSGNKTVSVMYVIPYLGTANGAPIEIDLAYTTAGDTIFGNYLERYTDWGEIGLYLSGRYVNGKYALTVKDYNKPLSNLQLSGTATALSGTYRPAGKGKTKSIQVKPAVSIAANPQINYKYRLITQEPTEDDELPSGGNTYLVLKAIEIRNSSGKHLQTLDFESYITGDKVITLSDYNFDGYLDMSVEVRYPLLAKGDWGNFFYLYNPASGLFEKSDALEDFRVINVYYGKKEILRGDADGSGNESNIIYKWFNDKLLMVKKVYTAQDDPKTHYEEYTVQNGKSILIKEYSE
jgi:hypothetical protein